MKAWSRSGSGAGAPGPCGGARRAAGWLPMVAALSLACASCSGGERVIATAAGDRLAVTDAARPEVVCQPPHAGASALVAVPYVVCTEYQAGRIDRATYAAALSQTGAMIIAVVALDTLDARDKTSPSTVRARRRVVQALHQNTTMQVICRAPSLAAHGALPACAVLHASAVAKPVHAASALRR